MTMNINVQQYVKELHDAGITYEYANQIRGIYDSSRGIHTYAGDAAMLHGGIPNTQPNAGMQWFIYNYIYPKAVNVLLSPTVVGSILGEEKQGTWVDESIQFNVIEQTGMTSSYGDWSDQGMSSANVNVVPRQAYYFQTIIEYGERQAAKYSKAKINFVEAIINSAANSLNRMQNYTYAYGVQGLVNYGILNDPNLPASITPLNAGTTDEPIILWKDKQALDIFNDIKALLEDLVTRADGLVSRDSRLKLVMSPASYQLLTTSNMYGINVPDLIKKNYPNLTIDVVPEYGNKKTGNVVQAIALDVETEKTGFSAFSEKMHTHAAVVELSGWKQKRCASSYGTIILQPVLISTMVGV